VTVEPTVLPVHAGTTEPSHAATTTVAETATADPPPHEEPAPETATTAVETADTTHATDPVHAVESPVEPQPVATVEPMRTVIAAPTPTDADAVAAQGLYQEARALQIDTPERLTKLEEAVRLNPGSPLYGQQLAFDYFRNERYADCVALCDRSLERTPTDSKLLMIKGSALISLEKWEEAVKACRASVEADATNNYARHNLALALEMMHDPEAADAWRRYLTHAANDPQHQGLLLEARQRLEALQ
jgi:tetratricopeptide (TPR) repeat protein